MTLTIEAPPIRFEGGAGFDGFYIETLDGWFDGVDLTTEEIRKVQAHGSFDVPGYLDSRTVTVTGEAHAPSSAVLDSRGDALAALMTSGVSSAVTVSRDSKLTWAMGQRRRSRWQPKVIGRSCDYQFVFWCANPRRFGDYIESAAGVDATVYQYGTFVSSPIITVTGSMPSGYTIEGPGGRTITVTQPVVSGHPHVVDLAKGRLRVDGSVVSGHMPSPQLWTIPANGVPIDIGLTPVSGTGQMVVGFYETFI